MTTSTDMYTQGLVHDLTNVLTVLEARLELAERMPPAAGSHHVRRARTLAEEAASLAHHLMRYLEGKPPRLESVPVAPLLRQVVESELQDTRVRWQIAAHPDTRPLAADPLDAQRVIRNLVANAAEAMDNSGLIVISATNGEAPDEAAYVVVTVQDAGPGLTESQAHALGQRLASAKGGMHGMGLQVVHHLVTAHGGHVDVTSRPGHGTTVRILWPAWSGSPPA
jgi:signal transduction histidine kinase